MCITVVPYRKIHFSNFSNRRQIESYPIRYVFMYYFRTIFFLFLFNLFRNVWRWRRLSLECAFFSMVLSIFQKSDTIIKLLLALILLFYQYIESNFFNVIGFHFSSPFIELIHLTLQHFILMYHTHDVLCFFYCHVPFIRTLMIQKFIWQTWFNAILYDIHLELQSAFFSSLLFHTRKRAFILSYLIFLILF